jgi:hypothetical protein
VLGKIVRRGYNVFEDRIRLSSFEKLAIAGTALTRRYLLPGNGSR